MTFYNIPAGLWTIDPTHSNVDFQVKHLMVSKVKGKFGDFSGTAIVTDQDFKLEAIIDVTTIDTNNADRDTHLRSADFFDVDNYSAAVFVSQGFEKASEDTGTIYGELTMHGVTKEVAFDVEFGGVAVDPYGNTKAALEGKATISRGDFGLTWNTALETGGVLVSDEVKLSFDVQAVLAQ